MRHHLGTVGISMIAAHLALAVPLGAAAVTGDACPPSIAAPVEGTPGLRARFTSVGMGPNAVCYGVGTLPPSWGDYDGDGDLDLPLFRNDGDGTFSDTPGFRALLANGNYHGASWADYDGDGDLDLSILPYGPSVSALLLQNQGDGTFADVAPALGMDIPGYGETAAWGDYDGDGDVDLFAPYYAHAAPQRSFLFRNEGDGSFTEVAIDAGVSLPEIPPLLRPEGAHWADWDGDGRLDLYCAWHLFLNDGNGGFTDVREEVGLPQLFDEGSMFLDFDDDGDLDLWLRAIDGGKLFRNDCGAMVDVTAQAGIPPGLLIWGDSWADVDHNGFLDLVLMRNSAAALLLLNQGDGTFAEDLDFTALDVRADNSAWGDHDGDGDLDLVTGAYCHELYRNDLQSEPGFADSFLRVAVLDGRGHQTQHGATIRLRRVVDEGHGIQTRIVDGGSGYLSQSQYDAHFGVDGDAVHALEVVFPSADTPVVVDAAVNAGLGWILPRDLAEKTITVQRDGWATINGDAWGPPAASLLANGSMEEDDDDDGVPDGWKRRGAARSNRTCLAEALSAPHQGSCGFRFLGGPTRPAAMLRQTVGGLDGRAGDRLKLGAWLRGRKLSTDAQLKVKLRLSSAGVPSDTTSFEVTGTTFPYQGRLAELVASAPYDAARVQINVRTTSGWVAVDDVILTAASDPAGALPSHEPRRGEAAAALAVPRVATRTIVETQSASRPTTR